MSPGENDQMCVNVWCLNQTILPWAGGGCVACYNRLVPDGEVGVEDKEWVAAAVGLWVWTRKHSSQHEQFSPKHAAAVVGQRRNLPLSLGGRERGGGCEEKGWGAKMDLKQAKHTHAHLHHEPLPALSVQNVNIVEPLLVLRSSKHKDPPWVRVVDSCVANPGLRCRTLCQSLCCNPGHVLCWTQTKTLALTWSHRKIKNTILTGEWHRLQNVVHDWLTCAELPHGIFAELHPGSLSSNQNSCLSIDGTQSLTPATWRADQWGCRKTTEVCLFAIWGNLLDQLQNFC